MQFQWSIVSLENSKIFVKRVWKCKRPRTVKANNKKNKLGGTHFRYQYSEKLPVSKTVLYWGHSRQTLMEQNPETDQHICTYMAI